MKGGRIDNERGREREGREREGREREGRERRDGVSAY